MTPVLTHGVREPEVTVRRYTRIMAFFDQHLRLRSGVAPRPHGP